MSKVKCVMYNNETRIVDTFKDDKGEHARIYWLKSKCPVITSDGHCKSWEIKRWVKK